MRHQSSLAAATILLATTMAFSAEWWEKKPYTTWTKDDVTNMLDKSPWGKIHSLFFERISHFRQSGGDVQGTEHVYDKINFHVCFLYAQPIRMALVRRTMLADPEKKSEVDPANYIDQEDDQKITLIMRVSGTPADTSTYYTVASTLDSLKTADFDEQTFLATDGGKKVALLEYNALGEKGMGVKFVFPRLLPDGAPFISPGNKEIRFETMIPMPKDAGTEIRVMKVSLKWDLKKMMYNGKADF